MVAHELPTACRCKHGLEMLKTNHKNSRTILRNFSMSHMLYLGLLLAIVYLAVRIVLVLVSPQSVWLPVPAARSVQSLGVDVAPTQFDFSVDPFNRRGNAAATPSRLDAPQTTLNLTLLGLRALDKAPSGGSAVIQTPDKVQRRFDVGEEIIRGVTLEAVYKDYVILSQNSQNERLDFARKSESALSAAPNRKSKNDTTSNAQTITTLQDVLAQVTLRRVMEDGQVSGYELIAARAGADISVTGLAFGDIVIAVNGAQVRSEPDPGRLLAQLNPALNPSVTVIRDGKTQTIRVSRP